MQRVRVRKVARYGELAQVAWHSGNSGYKTHPVGLKKANGWGLKDMLGNVFEWTMDASGSYAGLGTQDPLRSSRGSKRVNRGGGWSYFARNVRSAGRFSFAPTDRYHILGFRLLRY